MAVNMELADSTEDFQPFRHVKMRVLLEPPAEIDVVLAHDVVQEEKRLEAVEIPQ